MENEELELAIKSIILRTGLPADTIRDLLERDWMYVEQLDRPHRWEKVPWLERKARNAKR